MADTMEPIKFWLLVFLVVKLKWNSILGFLFADFGNPFTNDKLTVEIKPKEIALGYRILKNFILKKKSIF